MRKASIYYKDQLAGTLIETDDGEYVFQYDEAYIKAYPSAFIIFTMPVRFKPYHDKRCFHCFVGTFLKHYVTYQG